MCAPGRTVALSGFLLGTVSGSGTATAVSLGAVTWPVLKKAGYPKENAGGMLAIGEDVKGMLDFMRPMYALYVGGMGARGKNFYNDLACEYGYEKEAKEIQDLYLSGKKKEAEALVPTDWLEAGNLVGPESYVKERIAAFAEAGVTHLSVSPASADPAGDIAKVKE